MSRLEVPKKEITLNSKKMLGALLVSAALPMALFAFGSPAANAVSVTATITTNAECVWALSDVPTSIHLSTDEIWFWSKPIATSTVVSPKLGFAGDAASATAGDSKACSFYSESMASKKLTLALDGDQFVASYGGTPDPDMNFALSQQDVLLVTVGSMSDKCTAPVSGEWGLGWEEPGGGRRMFQGPTDRVVHAVAFGWGADPAYDYDTGEASRCAPDIDLTLLMPASEKPPAGKGEQYSFVGPSMTFTLASND